jgi:hypothetical protein
MELHIKEILKSAILAPSVDNCQPWIFSVNDNVIELALDLKRANFFGDVNHSASYVSCGTVIENIKIASNHLGYSVSVEYFPSQNKDVIARIKILKNNKTSNSLYNYIPLRCTNRQPFKKGLVIPFEILESLKNCSSEFPGSSVYFLHDRISIKKIACLIRYIDRIIFDHPLLHQGLFKWVRWTQSEAEQTGDGMPVATLGLNIIEQKMFKLISSWRTLSILNKFGANKLIANHSYRLVKNCSAVGLITMDKNSPVDYIVGGRLFEKVWLTATANNIALQPFGGIIFLITKILCGDDQGFSPPQRKIIKEVYSSLCSIFPLKKENALIILFRLGYAKEPPVRSLRKNLFISP